MNKIKYFLALLAIILLSTSFCAATECDNTTQSDYDTQDLNIPPITEDNNIETTDNNPNYENTIQKQSTENLKRQESTNITTITESNYNNYLSINNNRITLNKQYFVPGNDYTIDFTYIPTGNKLEINDFNNTQYSEDTIKIIGQLTDTNLIVNKSNLKSVIMEDLTLDYNTDYTGEYVEVSSAILNRVTINVDTDRNAPSVPLYVTGKGTVIENSTINAKIPSSPIDWNEGNKLPNGVGIWIGAENVTLANNFIDITDSVTIENYGFNSIYGVYTNGNSTSIYNNTFSLTATNYAYGIVLRSSKNDVFNNAITVISEDYTAGVIIEGSALKDNNIHDNLIDVSAGYGTTNLGYEDVVYACLMIDTTYHGMTYTVNPGSCYNNNFINNTILCSGNQVYALEIWGGVNGTYSGNNIIMDGTYPMGMGVIGINMTMNDNTITADGTKNDTGRSVDYLNPRTVGIYLYLCEEGSIIRGNTIYTNNGRALLLQKSKNSIIENNLLTTSNYAYVIEVDDSNNTFKDNALMGEGPTEEVIKDTSSVENIYINNIEYLRSILKINARNTVKINEETDIIISLEYENGNVVTDQYVDVQIDDGEVQRLKTDDEGLITIKYTPTREGIATISATYESYQDIGSSATKEITINRPLILTPETFDTYITNGVLNDNVPEGAFIDVQGKFDNEKYAFTVNKPVNIYSSTNDAFFSFFSTPKTEGTSELPDHSFIINSEGSGSNITGITFENTMIVTTEAHDVTFDNITVYSTSGYGWGRGSTSIRNSQNITIKNSYFNTKDNNGVSSVVFAASQNCLLENSTIVGSGFLGNLVYVTTYNVEVKDEYGNDNITIRNNKIIARDLNPGIATCYSVCLEGTNLIVENNYIENSNKFLLMTQYIEEGYDVAGDTGSLTIKNNEFGPGIIEITFDPCTIENNTFYGDVRLNTLDSTIEQNNIYDYEDENPYLTFNTTQEHDALITISAPKTYYYNTPAQINITLTQQDNTTPITSGRLEIYVNGSPYKNITVTDSQITFDYLNETLGTHRIRAWYYTPTGTVSNSQKLVTLEAIPIGGKLELQTSPDIHIGDTITLNVTYTLDEEVPVDVNITFELPGQPSITIPTTNKQASLETTITNDYIRDILGGREQNIKITASTNDSNVDITGINQKLGVQKANTQITITPNNTTINTQTTITATINTPTNIAINTGTVTFTDKDGNTIATSNVKNNKATTTYTFNKLETIPITATYSGTTYYEANTTTIDIKVQKQDTKITINNIPDTTYTRNITLTGKLTDNNNNILKNMPIALSINNDTVNLTTDNNGIFTYTFRTPTAGQNNITASYDGNTNYNPTSTKTTVNIKKQDLKIIIDPIKTVTYGHDVTITGKFVDGDGNLRTNVALRIYINGKSVSTRTDANGRFNITSKVGVIGTNNVTSNHTGDKNFNPTSTTTTFQMKKQDLIITVDKISDVIYGSSINITGTLKDGDGTLRANTGVKILINGKSATAKTDKNGKYAFTTKIGKLGVNNVTVSHAGGANYNPTSASTTYKVVKQDLKITLDNIGTVTYGSVTIKGRFIDSNNNPRANTGLKVSINGKTATTKTDKDGYFTLTTKVGVVGVNNVSAYHQGGGNYNPVNVSTTFKMIKQDLKVTIDPIKTVTYGNNVVITGTFTDGSGKVRANSALKIIINGKTLTTRTDANGRFNATSKVGVVGVNNVTVAHSGGTGFNPTSTNTTFKMIKQDLKITINPINSVKKGNMVTVTGTFTDANGKIRANTNLKVKLNGKEYTTKTDAKGVFTFSTTASVAGSNTIMISHNGGTNFNPASAKSTFTVTS